MVRLKNRNMAPPSGFIVDVPETGFHQVQWGFDQAVSTLQAHLGVNPGIFTRFPTLPRTRFDCEEYVDTRNAQRCLTIKGGENYILKGGQFTPPPFRQAPRQAVQSGAPAAAVDPVKPPSWFKQLGRLGTGAKTLADWLGKGGVAVAPELSEARSAICAKCPKNSKGDWTSHFTVHAANLIRRQLEERKQLKLSTTNDAQLGVCEACGCPLRLKLHTPLKVILDHQPPETTAALDPGCWLLTEK